MLTLDDMERLGEAVTKALDISMPEVTEETKN